MIVAHHFAVHSAASWPEGFSSNQYIMGFLASFGKIGVGLFFTITGYFLFQAKNQQPKKLFATVRPVWFYSLILFGIFLLLGKLDVNLSWPLNSQVAQSIFPILTNSYWFIGAYIGLHLFSPYFKIWFDSMNKKQIITFLAISIGLWNITAYSNFIISGHFNPIFAMPIIIIYPLIGYSFHRFKSDLGELKPWAIIGLLISVGVFLVGPVIRYFLSTRFNFVAPINLFWTEESIFSIMFVVSLFILMIRLNFSSRIINYIGGLTFGIYLIHENTFVRGWLWNDFLRVGDHIGLSSVKFIAFAIISILFVFLAGSLIEAIRKLATKGFFILCSLDKNNSK